MGTCSMGDAFLDQAPTVVDMYLVVARGTDDSVSSCPESVRLLGEPAASLAIQHGLTAGNLADGLWALLPAGASMQLPPWLKPLFRLLPPKQKTLEEVSDLINSN